eukprot:g1134.t1
MEGKRGWPKKFKKTIEGKESDTQLKHVMQVRVSNPDVWTWHTDLKGKAGYAAVKAAGLVYQFECDDKAISCQTGGVCNIRARLSSWWAGPLAKLMPMNFWMVHTPDPLNDKNGLIWERRSTLKGVAEGLGLHLYKFRKITDANKKPIEGPYQAYLGCVEAGKAGKKKCTVPGEGKDKATAIPESFLPMDKPSDKDLAALKEHES